MGNSYIFTCTKFHIEKMQDIEIRKRKIIRQIRKFDQESLILKIEGLIETLHPQPKSNHEIFKTPRKSISVEEMKKEQNYSGIDRMYFDNLIQEIDIQEPIQQLLAME